MRAVALVVTLAVAICMVIAVGLGSVAAKPSENNGGGYDEFGYNYEARMFCGPADGVDRVLDDAVWGVDTYANDHLVMKWSEAWNDARYNGEPWTPDAWCTNHWNGNVPGGSGESEQCKIVWFGNPDHLPDGTELPDGGYVIWGEFEVIMDHYVGPDGEWFAHATPNGLG
jgi:hypothetical protein